MQITAAIFERGGGAAHHGDESLEEVGDGVTVPGGGHDHPNTANMMQSGCPRRQLMMMSIHGQHGENLAATEANTAIDDPDAAIGKGGRLQRQAPTGAGRVHAHDGEPDDQLMMVWGHAALRTPTQPASKAKTREAALELRQAQTPSKPV